MDNADEDYGGPERRQERNADLRAYMKEIAEKVGDYPPLTEDDLRQLYLLMRDLYWAGIGSSRTLDLLELVREEHTDEFNPAMLALLDNVLGRRGA